MDDIFYIYNTCGSPVDVTTKKKKNNTKYTRKPEWKLGVEKKIP